MDDDRSNPDSLEIPEALRGPVDHPAVRRRDAAARDAGSSAMGSGWADAAKPLAIGIDFLVMAATGGALGWAADRWAGTGGFGIVGGLILGFVVGTFRLVQRLNAPDKGAAKPRI
ncbi:hypothetical protein BH11PLA1_BH11PLA1_06670 [soil metagenome]